MRSLFKSRAGFSLVEVSIAAAIVSSIALLAYYPMSRVGEIKVNSESYVWLEVYKWEIESALRNIDSWELTKLNNSVEFDCIINNTDCSPKKATRDTNYFRIYSSGMATPINDSVTLTNGFTYTGTPCNTFTYAGNDDCPFRVVAVWEPLCVTGACVSPDIRFYISFKYAPGPNGKKRLVLDMNRYSFKMVMAGSAVAVEGAEGSCAAMGGQFYPDGGGGSTCILDNPASLCSAIGHAPVGFDSNNNVICQPVSFNYTCPADEYFMGVDYDGNPHCGKCP